MVDLLGIGSIADAAAGRPLGRREADGSPSAGRCWRSRGCCSWTNRFRRSTIPARPRSSPISNGCAMKPACRSSMCRIRWPRSRAWPTRSWCWTSGRVSAVGPAAEVLARLDIVSLAGSREAGAVLEARILSQDDRYGLTRLSTPAGELRVPRIDLPRGSRLRVQVLARDVTLSLAPPTGSSALNVLTAVVAEVPRAVREGAPSLELRLDCGGVALLARITRTLGLRYGPKGRNAGLRRHQERCARRVLRRRSTSSALRRHGLRSVGSGDRRQR